MQRLVDEGELSRLTQIPLWTLQGWRAKGHLCEGHDYRVIGGKLLYAYPDALAVIWRLGDPKKARSPKVVPIKPPPATANLDWRPSQV